MILTERYNYPLRFYEKSLSTLETALATTPAYSDWRVLDPGVDKSINERYDVMPVLTKQIIRDSFPGGLVPNYRDLQAGLDVEEIEYTFTSGTTGDRVINTWDQKWWDAAEASAWQLNAHTAHLKHPQPEAKLASSLNVGISCEEDLPYSSRLVGHRLYLNEKINLIQWQPRHYQRMVDELAVFQPVILEANPSLLARLAYWIADQGIEVFQPAIIVFTYEFTSVIHKSAIGRVFTAPQISSYGTTETGFVLQECEAGLLHQNLDYCRIDYQPLKPEYGGPEIGRILVTTFENPWNIVVRFDVGDLIRLYSDSVCPCGRNEGMIVEAVEGRVSNSTFTTNNGLVTTMALDQALAKVPAIRDYNMEQYSRNEYRISVMGDPMSDSPKGTAELIEATNNVLSALYGADGIFQVSVVSNILPGPAGKFRRSQTSFEFDEKGLFE
ncbi:MAG: hypothetical protein LBU61_04440 [Coriobacteriales bacterium]|jgi:phenylacetate-coenzyme A ligase PaaK-like adenylate-forming protein|nr:hypothetical protein [Coriobacteriales bacterium]